MTSKTGENSNQNKNILNVSKEKLKKLGILKILNIIIAEGEEDKYVCIMENGSKKIFPVSKLVK